MRLGDHDSEILISAGSEKLKKGNLNSGIGLEFSECYITCSESFEYV